MLSQAEQQRQMREHSGPLYELAVERGKIASAAWQKPGRPRKVTRVWGPVHDADGVIVRDASGDPVYEARWYRASTLRSGNKVAATPEQVAAWQAYQESRPSFEPRHGLPDDQVRLARHLTGDPLEEAAARHRQMREAAAAGNPIALEAVKAIEALDEWPDGLPPNASDQDIARYEATLRRYLEVSGLPWPPDEESRGT